MEAREKVVVFVGGLLIVLIVLSPALAAETVTVTLDLENILYLDSKKTLLME